MDLSKIAVHLFKNAPAKLRNLIYSICGFSINGANIRNNVFITSPKQLILGNNVFINHNCSFFFGGGNGTITIHDNVEIGPSCVFTTINHNYSNPQKRSGKCSYANITIGEGSWIGCSCTILPGVNIGKGCVIAAGAVVVENVPDNQLYGGVPARFIRDLST